MAFVARLNDDYRFIEVQYMGKIETFEVENGLAARAKLTHEHGIINHMIECSEVEAVPGISDLSRIAEHIRDILNYPIHRVAMVLPRSDDCRYDLLLFVVKAYHCGIMIDMFNNRERAVDWLISSSKSWLSDSA